MPLLTITLYNYYSLNLADRLLLICYCYLIIKSLSITLFKAVNIRLERLRALRATREHYDRQHAHKRRTRISPPIRARVFKCENEVTATNAKGKGIARPSKPPPRTAQTHHSQTIPDYYSKAPASTLHTNIFIPPPFEFAPIVVVVTRPIVAFGQT